MITAMNVIISAPMNFSIIVCFVPSGSKKLLISSLIGSRQLSAIRNANAAVIAVSSCLLNSCLNSFLAFASFLSLFLSVVVSLFVFFVSVSLVCFVFFIF